MTLSYAFMLSFTGFLEPHIDSTTWPLVWIVSFWVVLIDPLRLWHRPSRFWLLRNWMRLAAPGFTSVEVSSFLDRGTSVLLLFSLRISGWETSSVL